MVARMGEKGGLEVDCKGKWEGVRGCLRASERGFEGVCKSEWEEIRGRG